MELTPYLDGLRRDLAAAAAPGGEEIRRAADLLGGSLEASARLCLMEALSDAAAEITTRLNRASVEVRLRGRDAELVVTELQPVEDREPTAGRATPTEAGDISGELARMTLRLPEALKEAVERAAAAESISVNAWLVRAISQFVAPHSTPEPPQHPPTRGPGRLGRRVTGFAQA